MKEEQITGYIWLILIFSMVGIIGIISSSIIFYWEGHNDAKQEAYCSDYCFHNTLSFDFIDCVETCNDAPYSNQWRFEPKEAKE